MSLNSEMLSIVSKSETEPQEYERYLELLRIKNKVLEQLTGSILEQLTGTVLSENGQSESGFGGDREVPNLYSRLVGLEYELRACLDKKKQGVFDQLQKIRNLRNSKGKYKKNGTMVSEGSFLSLSTGD